MINHSVLDKIDLYAKMFNEHGYATIDNFWTDEFAESVYVQLQRETKWDIATLREGRAFVAGLDEFHQQTPEFKNAFLSELLTYANKNDFQYLYEFLRLAGADKKPITGYEDLIKLLSNKDYQSILCRLTSLQKTTELDAQLTKYASGYFLKKHCDTRLGDGQQRHAAIIINLTKDWSPDYGGLLNLQNEKGDIVATLTPRFNSLTLLSIPFDHFVSQVATYVDKNRYCLIGWLWKEN